MCRTATHLKNCPLLLPLSLKEALAQNLKAVYRKTTQLFVSVKESVVFR